MLPFVLFIILETGKPLDATLPESRSPTQQTVKIDAFKTSQECQRVSESINTKYVGRRYKNYQGFVLGGFCVVEK